MHIKSFKAGMVFFTLLSLVIAFSFPACRNSERMPSINSEAEITVSHIPFNLQRAIFINQYTRPSERIASWIWGDSAFINQTLPQFFQTRNDGRLCILHWSQAGDPVWIGARIPGKFLGADLLVFENNELVVRRYTATGEAGLAGEDYRDELRELLKQVDFVRYP